MYAIYEQLILHEHIVGEEVLYVVQKACTANCSKSEFLRCINIDGPWQFTAKLVCGLIIIDLPISNLNEQLFNQSVHYRTQNLDVDA